MKLKITDHIYWIQIPFCDIYTSVFLIQTDQGNILYDTATTEKDVDTYIQPVLEELGVPVYTVLSHPHGDHAGGLDRVRALYPNTRVPEGLTDGETVLGPVQAIALPGHTLDSIALFDSRTGTLLTGDGLQLYGIYGKGKWGTGISYPQAHLKALERLKQLPVKKLIASHSYHPLGACAEGPEQIRRYYAECAEALRTVCHFIRTHPELEGEALAEAYHQETGLPAIHPGVIKRQKLAFSDHIDF